MKIKYLGHSSFNITGKGLYGEQVTVVTDPFDKKDVGLPYSKQTADIVTISHDHADHNAIQNIEGTEPDNYKLITTPGEYEIKGVRIFGVKSFHDDKQGKERGDNTIFIYDFAEARVAHLGDLGHKLDSNQQEALENVDIIIVPVGGIYTVDAKTALEVAEAEDPKIIIPMHYKTDKHAATYSQLGTLQDFMKEAGTQTEPQKDLSIKTRSDLPLELSIIPLMV